MSSTIVFCDTSEVAFCDSEGSLNGSVVSREWTSGDIVQSSTHRGRQSIACVSYLSRSWHKTVKVFTDNQSAARTVPIERSAANLQRIALDLFHVCLQNGITVEAQWIPRSFNERAHLLSQFADREDWSVHPSVFLRFQDFECGVEPIHNRPFCFLLQFATGSF